MAQRMKKTTRYETYGSVAYEATSGDAVLSTPRGGTVAEPMPLLRPEEEAKVREKVKVRQAGTVSPFAVIGFLCVVALAILLLVNCARLAIYTNEVTTLRTELSELEEEQSNLLVKYELAYNLNSIKEDMLASGTMVEPTDDQRVTLDLSESDNIVVYNTSDGEDTGLFEQIGNFFANLFG